MQSRKPPLPRKPVLPPKPNRQCAQASGSPRRWPPATEEGRPPVSPLPLTLSPRLPGRGPGEELPTPPLPPKKLAFTATRENKEQTPGFKSFKPLSPDGSEKTDSEGVESEQPLSMSSSPSEHHKHNHCHCLCHQHRPGMKLVWVPVLDGSGTGPGDPEGKPDEKTVETTREKADEKEKCASQELKVTLFQTEGLYEPYDYSPAPPPRPERLSTPSPTVKRAQWAHTPPAQPAAHPSPKSSPRLDTKCKANAPEPPPRTEQGSKKESSSPNSEANPSLESRPLPPIPVPQIYRERTRPVLSYMLSPRGCPPPRRKQTIKSNDDLYESCNNYDYPFCDQSPETADVNLSDFCEWVSVEEKDIPEYIDLQADPPPAGQPSFKEANNKPKHRRTLNPTAKRVDLSSTQANGSGNAPVRRAVSLAPSSILPTRKRAAPVIVLWQERPAVKTSGVLESLSHRELQRQESMFEVLTSEESYLSSLRVLRDHFLGSRELNDTLVIQDKKRLFSNILQVYEVSERFLTDLQDRVDENVIISDVCDIIHNHAQNYFSVYTDYVRDQVYQEKTYSSLMQTNKSFAVVMRRLEESPLCKRLPFTSFLLLPFQRITRLKILIQNIVKKTEEGSKEEQTASQAFTVVSEIIRDTNNQVGKMKQMEELISIANKLEFQKLKAVPIVSKTRYLEKQGELLELSKAGSLFNIRLRFLPVYVFLFNDLFILTNKKGPDRYVVIDHAHRSLVQAQVVSEDELKARFDHCFCLTLLENHQGQHCQRLLKANTESDMCRWIAAMPSLTDPQQTNNEVIYEDWDCPQVQCVERYTAQQADELSLEPTDIINVLRKTHEGWNEGIRLSDGQKGWFPATNVLEITNEHQRRRNLLEQFRLHKLAANAPQT